MALPTEALAAGFANVGSDTFVEDTSMPLQIAFFAESLFAEVASVGSITLMDCTLVSGQGPFITEPRLTEIAGVRPLATMHSAFMSFQIVVTTDSLATLLAFKLPLGPSRLGRRVGHFDPDENTTPFILHAPRSRPSQRRRITTDSANVHRTKTLQNQRLHTAASRQSRTTTSISLPGAANPPADSSPASRLARAAQGWHKVENVKLAFSRLLEGGTAGTVPFLKIVI